MKSILVAILASCSVLTASQSIAQNYPNQTIKLVVPLAPGGSADVLGRLLAEKLSRKYGQSVVVENRAGAGGNIGAEAVSKSAPDGYTLLLGTMGIHSTFKIYPKLNYNPTTGLVPVTILAEMPNVLVVAKNVDVKNTGDLISKSKAAPGQYFFGSAGFGSSTHMAGELFKYQSNAPIMHVPYKGSGPALTDLVGGSLQLMFENLPTALPLIKSGKIRALAVTGGQKAPSLPETPTISEDGLPGYSFTAWMTIAAPANTPKVIVDQLNKDIQEVMLAPELQPQLAEMGVTPVPGHRDPVATQAFIAEQTASFSKMIEETKLVAN